MRRTTVFVIAGLLPVACTSPGATPCAGVECSLRGFCIADQGRPYCACLPGYHPVGLACEPNEAGNPCARVDCSGHGRCVSRDGDPLCECDPGYRSPAETEPSCEGLECDLLCLPGPGGTDADASGGEDGRDDGEAEGQDDAGGADADGDADAPREEGAGEDGDGETPVVAECGNLRVEAPEECDDGNTASGDGCETDCRFSCHAAGECADGNTCTDDACVAGGTGRVCANAVRPAGSGCDDDRFCTLVDVCDGRACVGSGSPCDGMACAAGCDEGGDGCLPAGPGTVCRPSADTCDVPEQCSGTGLDCPGDAYQPDMTACPDGRCCSGGCQAGAECCSDGNCEPGCEGVARPCSSFTSMTLCIRQAGCTWTGGGAGPCVGAAVPCPSCDEDVCHVQEDCYWLTGYCDYYRCERD